MAHYTLFIDKKAVNDIHNGVNFYNNQVKGLGKRFHSQVNKTFKIILQNPFFQIRYNDVRCILVRKFPYMVHHKINDELKAITIYAVLHSSLNPDENWIQNI